MLGWNLEGTGCPQQQSERDASLHRRLPPVLLGLVGQHRWKVSNKLPGGLISSDLLSTGSTRRRYEGGARASFTGCGAVIDDR